MDLVDYRANHHQDDCRVAEIQTANRWGTGLIIRRLVRGEPPVSERSRTGIVLRLSAQPSVPHPPTGLLRRRSPLE